jgi:LuxR family maltose regulon positive regulatory protein
MSPSSNPNPKNVRYFSERLLKAFRVILENPLTVVEAPMGYGKTEAVKAFLRIPTVKVVWTSAQATSPESFWPDFCKELARVFPNASEAAKALKTIGYPLDQVLLTETLKIMRRLTFPPKTVFVFDDCHLMPNSFIAFCEGLARESGLNAKVVSITRNAWGGGQRLPSQGKILSRIEMGVLALTAQEIREYFALCGSTLSPEDALSLREATEGWISAVYLSLLWYKKTGDLSSIPKDISTWIKETVYDPLSSSAKELLLAVTPLERFTASQAARLHSMDAPALLDELTAKNAFVSFDPVTRFYYPHAVFRQLLQEIFNDDRQVPPDRRRQLLRACGEELLADGELASAMEAWYKAGDFERALGVLESDMTRNLVTERAQLYVAMFEDCPEEILERHMGACFKYALAIFSVGDYANFRTQLRWLAKHCASMPSAREARRWQGELHVLLALTKFNDIVAMGEHHRQSLELLEQPTILYGFDSTWSLGCPSVLLMFYRESGQLKKEVELMHEYLPLYYPLASFHGAGAEYLMEAEAYYMTGEVAKASDSTQKALEMAGRHNQLGNALCAFFLQIRLALLEGDTGTLFGDGSKLGVFTDMRNLIARGRDRFMLHTADLCEGWLYGTLGLYESIPLWLRSKLSQDSRLYSFAKAFFPIVHGRAQLLAGKHAEVIKDFKTLLAEGTYENHVLLKIYARIYLAAAFQKTDRKLEAAETLGAALDSALPDDVFMPFAENYDLIAPFFSKAIVFSRDEAKFARLLELAERVREGRNEILSGIQAREAFASLSKREAQTLSLLAAGHSTRETAEKMGVSVHTVRAHLKSAARKTGIRGRVALLQLFSKNPEKIRLF